MTISVSVACFRAEMQTSVVRALRLVSKPNGSHNICIMAVQVTGSAWIVLARVRVMLLLYGFDPPCKILFWSEQVIKYRYRYNMYSYRYVPVIAPVHNGRSCITSTGTEVELQDILKSTLKSLNQV